MISLELLDRVEAFRELDPEQRKKFQIYCREIEYHMGDKLFSEGEPAHHLWTVIEGQVDLRFEMPDKRKTTADFTVTSVDVRIKNRTTRTLGWSCFVPPYKMRLSAFCVTETCQVVRIDKKDLQRIFYTNPRIGYRFMSFMVTVVGYRFQQFQDEIARNAGEHLMGGW